MTPEERANKKLLDFFDSIHPEIRSSEETILTSIAKDLMIEAIQESTIEAVEKTLKAINSMTGYSRASNSYFICADDFDNLTPENILGNAYERKTPL